MKKLSLIVVSIICLTIFFSLNAFASYISVYVDNELVQLTDATGANVYPFIQNGTTYVPLRGISETLDCDVVWDANNKTVLIYKEMQSDNSVFRNKSDDVKLYVDNQLVELKDANGTTVKPFIKDGTTYVPLRGVSQALGCWVRWNGQTKTVSVYMNTVPPNGVTLSENKPYELNGWKTEGFYEDNGNLIEIDDVDYTNSLRLGDYDSSALFNLNGKFDSVSMKIGGHYGWNGDETTVTFIVDGKIVESFKYNPNSKAENVVVDLNKGNQLKIVVPRPEVRLGNIIFWGE